MDGIIWMDNDVIIQSASMGGLYVSHLDPKRGRVNTHIKTLDDLSDWLYIHGYGERNK